MATPILAAALPVAGQVLGGLFNRQKKFDPIKYFQENYGRLRDKGFGRVDVRPILAGIERDYGEAARKQTARFGEAARLTDQGQSVSSLFAPGRFGFEADVGANQARRETVFAADQAQQQNIMQALTAGLPAAAESGSQPSGLNQFLGSLFSGAGQLGGQYLQRRHDMNALNKLLMSDEFKTLEPSTQFLIRLMMGQSGGMGHN